MVMNGTSCGGSDLGPKGTYGKGGRMKVRPGPGGVCLDRIIVMIGIKD